MAEITDIVEKDEDLRGVIDHLLKEKYLCPGAFEYRAYMRTEKMSAARKRRGRWNAIATGVDVYNDLFHELACSVLRRETPAASPETQSLLNRWKKQVEKDFPEESDDIERACRLIGQYLEYTNRKSQGY